MEYYKNKYMIGLYTNDLYETCITIVDNSPQFAKLMNISNQSACTILKRVYDKKQNVIVYQKKFVKIELIEVEIE